MSMFERMAEEKIRAAIDEGAFDDLPGKGEPLRMSDLSGVAPELRAAYSVLSNAGVLPEEMELRKNLLSLRDLIRACAEDGERDLLVERERRLALRYELLMERRRPERELAGYRAAVLGRLFR